MLGKPYSSVPALPVGSRPVGTPPQMLLVLQLRPEGGGMGVSLGMLSLREVGGWVAGGV